MDNKYKIKINNTDIRLRPSSIDSFYSCAYKWGKTYLEGVNHKQNSRAAIGTAIHSAVETLWTEAIASGKKDPVSSVAVEAAMATWAEQTKDGVQFDDGESNGTAAVEIFRGTETFIEDIMPFSAIPIAVEEFFEIPLNTALVSAIGGTIDYRAHKVIADVKTSKRKITTAKHLTQQSIYKMLAEAHGHPIEKNLIQGIVLKKDPDGEILQMPVDVDLAKRRVNFILDTLDLIASDKAPAELLLRGNPSDPMCSPKYCSLYCGGCPYVKGEDVKGAIIEL